MIPVRMPRFPRDRTSYVKDGQIEHWSAHKAFWFIIAAACLTWLAGLATAYAIWRVWQ